MNLESLAQNVSDKTQDVRYKQMALSEAKLALSEARNTLSKALILANESKHDEVAIALKYHVVICTWDTSNMEYMMSFIPKVPNANT